MVARYPTQFIESDAVPCPFIICQAVHEVNIKMGLSSRYRYQEGDSPLDYRVRAGLRKH
jgi:hypothetical protein